MQIESAPANPGIGDDPGAVNRKRLERSGVCAVNLISAPGSGKTTLLERTAVRLRDSLRVGAIIPGSHAQDQIERLRRHGIQVKSPSTCGADHLDGSLLGCALAELDLARIDLLIIENVGDLICPAAHDLGEEIRVVLMSVTEDERSAIKYPAAFLRSDALVLAKIDLLSYVDFSAPRAIVNARSVNPDLEVFPVSCYTGEGLEDWTEWLFRRATHTEPGRNLAGSRSVRPLQKD